MSVYPGYLLDVRSHAGSWARQGPMLKDLMDRKTAIFLIPLCLSSIHISMKESMKYHILLRSRNKILNKTITSVLKINSLVGNIDTNNYITDAKPDLRIRLRRGV